MSSKNSMVAIAADKGGCSFWRSWFYPAGSKEAKISIQCVNGWVTFDPDPNRGFIVKHQGRPTNQSGRWMRGPMAPSACTNDVKIARALLGHRVWMVSHWRVHIYRLLAFALVMIGAMQIGWDSVTLAIVTALALFFWPSPCTPKGLVMWCESMGWAENKLAADKGLGESELSGIREMLAAEGESD